MQGQPPLPPAAAVAPTAALPPQAPTGAGPPQAAAAPGQPGKMSAMDQLLQYKQQLETDLVRVEAQIAEMESKFFQADHSATASVIKGFEAHLSSKEALRKRMQRSWRPEDRWFSLSSTTSPVTLEMQEQEAGEPALQGGFGKKGYPPAKGGYPQKGKR